MLKRIMNQIWFNFIFKLFMTFFFFQDEDISIISEGTFKNNHNPFTPNENP